MTMPSPEEIHAAATAAKQGAEVNLSPLAPVIRRINAANGWAPHGEITQIPEWIALIHTEFWKARTALFSSGALAAFPAGLADIIVCCLDTVELLNPLFLSCSPLVASPSSSSMYPMPPSEQQERLLRARDCVDMAMEAYWKMPNDSVMIETVQIHITGAAQLVARLMLDCGYSPTLFLTSVLLKSRERGHRHGGRRV